MMPYSLTHIHTAADCDLLIANAEKMQKDFVYLQIVLEKNWKTIQFPQLK